MSTNLFWRPIDSGKCLSKELKSILTKADIIRNGPVKLDHDHITVLKAIGVSTFNLDVQTECNDLIEAIEKYNEIELYIE